MQDTEFVDGIFRRYVSRLPLTAEEYAYAHTNQQGLRAFMVEVNEDLDEGDVKMTGVKDLICSLYKDPTSPRENALGAVVAVIGESTSEEGINTEQRENIDQAAVDLKDFIQDEIREEAGEVE